MATYRQLFETVRDGISGLRSPFVTEGYTRDLELLEDIVEIDPCAFPEGLDTEVVPGNIRFMLGRYSNEFEPHSRRPDLFSNKVYRALNGLEMANRKRA